MSTKGKSASMRTQRALRPLAWDEINEPGAYVDVSTGKHYRVTPERLPVGKSPLIPGSDTPVSPVVQVSKDPFIVALAARMICVDHNIRPNF